MRAKGAGTMREKRPGYWELRVYLGRDPVTGRPRQLSGVYRGNKRGAANALALLVAQATATEVDTHGTFGHLLDEWLDFAEPDGSEPLQPSSISKAFKRLAVAEGLDDVRLHDLRHLNASLLLAAGIQLHTVQARLGHANASTTLNIYGHMMPETDREAATVLGQLINGKHKPTPKALGGRKGAVTPARLTSNRRLSWGYLRGTSSGMPKPVGGLTTSVSAARAMAGTT